MLWDLTEDVFEELAKTQAHLNRVWAHETGVGSGFGGGGG